jgi:8-oxo-dGTP pyrophosphatase MutT (NUDIX family)
MTRHGARGPEVLMGRRRKKARFIPDAFVFPGGAVDRADYAVTPAAPPPPPTRSLLLGGGTPPSLATALCAAALRETEEETGLKPGGGAATAPDLAPLHFVARAITPVESPIRFHARFLHWDADRHPPPGELTETGELTDLHWVALEEALRLPIIDVTEFVISRMSARLRGRGAAGPACYTYRRGRPVVRELSP